MDSRPTKHDTGSTASSSQQLQHAINKVELTVAKSSSAAAASSAPPQDRAAVADVSNAVFSGGGTAQQPSPARATSPSSAPRHPPPAPAAVPSAAHTNQRSNAVAVAAARASAAPPSPPHSVSSSVAECPGVLPGSGGPHPPRSQNAAMSRVASTASSNSSGFNAATGGSASTASTILGGGSSLGGASSSFSCCTVTSTTSLSSSTCSSSGTPVGAAALPPPPPQHAAPSGSNAASASAASSAAHHPQQQQQLSSATANKSIAHRPAVFDKLEQLVRDMQDNEHGVPVRSQKMFLTSIPAAFMGYDLIEWLMDRLSIEDSLEAVHLANLLCQFGYYFPVNELKNLMVKDDSSLYRFQTPYYWPSQHHTPDNIEYAIYLSKRSQRNRQRHGLEDYEVEAYNNLRKILTSKWEFVSMQAEEQLKLNKDRKRGDKIVTDSQEKAYWRVYRPPPGYTTVVESSPVPTREQRVKARSRTREHLTEEHEFLRQYCDISRCKLSQVVKSLIEYTEVFYDFDPFLSPSLPSNPWIVDDHTYWIVNQPIVDCPSERRVRRWSISVEDLIVDPLGVQELMAYMKKEYSHENLRFWLAVQELKTGPGSEAKVRKKVKEIWDEFLSAGAKAEINIDGKTMEATKAAMKSAVPSRHTFEVAAEHVYTLLKRDCYPRFMRSDHYKAIISNAMNPSNQKKRFNFPFNVKKKISTAQQPPGPGGVVGVAVGAQGGPGQAAASGAGLSGGGGGAGTSGQGAGGPVHGFVSGAAGGTHQRYLALEDYSIYGADGGHEDPNARLEDTKEDDNVCPWDAAPIPSGGPGGAAMEEPIKPVKASPQATRSASAEDPRSPVSLCVGIGAAAAAEGVGGPRSHSKPESRKDSAGALTTQSREERRHSRSDVGIGSSSSSSHHHRHGHHGHEHHHHHGGSRRAKSKSGKRKRSARSKSGTAATLVAAAAAAAAAGGGPDKENVGILASEVLVAGTATAVISTAAVATVSGASSGGGSASPSLATTSVPAELYAGEGSDNKILLAADPSASPTSAKATTQLEQRSSMTNSSAAASDGTNADGSGSGAGGGGSTTTKCTQTKLDVGASGGAGGAGGDAFASSPSHQHSHRHHHHHHHHRHHSKTQREKERERDPDNGSQGGPLFRSNETLEARSALPPPQPQPPTALVLQSPKTSPTLGKSCGAEAAEASGASVASIDPAAAASVAPPGASTEGADAGASAASAAASSGSKLANASWSGSTEVCPWEDEENRKDSHAPFVKTYATLGYL